MKTIFENEFIRVESTGKDYDFIATIENKTDKKIRVHYKDMDLLDTYDTIDVEPNDWVGLLADEEGRGWVRTFELGQVDVEVLEKERENKMKKEQMEELLTIIENWCFQLYNERLGVSPKEAGTRIFELLPKYKNNFPKNCFYTGMVYRKMEKGSCCPKDLVACSYKKNANVDIGTISICHPRYYQSTCTDGYDLYNILLFLAKNLNIKIEDRKRFGTSLIERVLKEAEIICKMDRKNFRKQIND